MIPTVEEVCTKNIVTIEIDRTLEDAIQLMKQSNIRSVVIIGSKYYILTVNDTIKYKINNISLDTKLSNLTLPEIKKIDAKINLLEIINQEEIEYEYMVVTLKNKILGIVSQTDIINNIDPQVLIQKQSVGNLILQYTAITIYENESTFSAISIMQDKNIDSILIIDEIGNAIGIFTTKDFLNILSAHKDLKLPIKEYMSAPIQTVSSDMKIFDAIKFIQDKHFKRIIVIDEHKQISGIITQSELLRILNNKWLELIKQKGTELSKINQKLLAKTASLEEKASKDFLTKLYNRRKFDALIEYEIKQIKRYQDNHLSLIVIDIDGFKYINDTYGHDIGDIIIKEIAKIIKISIRESDSACRWGGEEFAISLSHTALDDACIVAEKIRVTIESNKFINDLRITCSLGVSQLHSDDTYTELFKRADEALYKAKNQGKNKVEIEHI